jgi:predicted HicB family RNase H-like nuclease
MIELNIIEIEEGVDMEEKKSRYTDAQKRAAEKYLKESVEDIRIRVPKGDKAIIATHASQMGESTNAFIRRAIDEAMQRDRGQVKTPEE